MANKNPQPRKKRTKEENAKIKDNRQKFCERIEKLCERRKDALYECGRVLNEEDKVFSSYRGIAREIGISESEFCRYRKGDADVPLWVLSKLASLFNTSSDYLIGRIPDECGTFSNHLLASELGISRTSYDNLREFSKNLEFRLVLDALLSAKCDSNIVDYPFRKIFNDAFRFSELTLQANEIMDEKAWLAKIKAESKFIPNELKIDDSFAYELPLNDRLVELNQKKEAVVLELYSDFKLLLDSVADKYNQEQDIINRRTHNVKKWIDSIGDEFRTYAILYGNNYERICKFIKNQSSEVSLEEIKSKFSYVKEETLNQILNELSKNKAISKTAHGYCA